MSALLLLRRSRLELLLLLVRRRHAGQRRRPSLLLLRLRCGALAQRRHTRHRRADGPAGGPPR